MANLAKPYRRRKNGKFIGNYRATVAGRDLNLGTKDPKEAMHRARLASAGKWPPEDAARVAAIGVLAPGAHPPPAPNLLAATDDLPPAAPPEAPAEPPASPPAPVEAPPEPSAPPEGAPTPGPSVPFEAAAAAAAAGASGTEGDAVTDEKLSREKQAEQELGALMSELSNGQGSSEIVDSVADGLAAGILWLERKSIELGWGWTFRKPTGLKLVTKPHNPAGIERKCIKVGMKAVLTIHFPELANKLTPGWAIAIGCTMGGIGAVATADYVDEKTNTTHTAQSIMEARAAAAANGAPAPAPAPAVS